TSNMIQFSWKPQGGTVDSPYTVRLLGKSGKIEERILNETSTAFEGLLSGTQYRISVDVSTCSKNVSTSLTVQTGGQTFRNLKSDRKFFMGLRSRASIILLRVVTRFDIVSDVGQNITETEISDAFIEALNRSTVFKVDLQNTSVEARNSCEPGFNDCDQNAACTPVGATYSCQCNKGFTDQSPQVPGRVCQQDAPSDNCFFTNTTGTGSTTPTPPNTNTTGFTGSTSNSIFNTPFTSAPCMTVSIEVQNVTREEIQLTWTSSSNSSLYNISIMEGKKINTTTTNETKAVIKNLLPGHLYTISVAVSSCAENKKTSVTVRTDPDSCFKRTEFCSAQSTACSDLKGIVCFNNQAFSCQVRLANETFNNALYNSYSADYIAMSERIKRDVVVAMSAELGNDHSEVVVLGFRPGSVVADFLFLLPKEEATDVDGIQAQLSRVLNSKFGNEAAVQCK
ncbi:MUA3 protein, partial [Catharus fuscescens]|nr:MUA3 protein [Catharus fuscescens]